MVAILLTLFALSDPAAQQDVTWLGDVQVSPRPAPAPARPLTPLLPPHTLAEKDGLQSWLARRAELLRAWNELLGPEPARPGNSSCEILQTERLAGVARHLVRYENEPGEFVTAYLLEPIDAVGTRPGVVALHETTDMTNQRIAGITGPDDRQIGLKLAQQGFVVICPENFLWRDGGTFDDAVAKFRRRHPHALGMRKMLFDAMRATDILAAHPIVDSQRMGAVGHSLGAKEVLYLTALDSRIAAAVFSEGGLELEATNWHAPWYLGPVVNQEAFARNHHELLALIAPRPFLVLGGEIDGAADGNRSWPYIAEAIPVYRLYRDPQPLGIFNHHEGHSLSAKSFTRAADWLRVYLQAQ